MMLSKVWRILQILEGVIYWGLRSWCSRLHFWRHWFNMTKLFPNLLNSSWLWWIMHVAYSRALFSCHAYWPIMGLQKWENQPSCCSWSILLGQYGNVSVLDFLFETFALMLASRIWYYLKTIHVSLLRIDDHHYSHHLYAWKCTVLIL